MDEQRRYHAIGEQLEKGLGSRGRLRLVGILARHPHEYFTRYALEKLSGVRSTWLRADLRALIELGWVRELPTEPRKYQLNHANPTVVQVTEFFRQVGFV